LIEEGKDRMREGFALPFPEQYFLAVGEKDIGDVQLPGIAFGLLGGITRTNGKAFGFDDG